MNDDSMMYDDDVSSDGSSWFSSLRIRNKLLLGFLTTIALTLVVVVVVLFAQNYTTKTVDEVLNVHNRMSLLSYEIETLTGNMAQEDRDFRLTYRTEGIEQAKAKHLEKFLEYNGLVYSSLEELADMVQTEKGKELTGKAMELMIAYSGSFLAAVNEVSSLLDPDTGEIAKINNITEKLREDVYATGLPSLQEMYLRLHDGLLSYRLTPTTEKNAAIQAEMAEFTTRLDRVKLAQESREKLQSGLNQFSSWFDALVEKESSLAALVQEYTQVSEQLNPTMAALRDGAQANQNKFVGELHKTQKNVLWIIVGIALLALALGVLMAFILSGALTRQIDHIMELLGDLGIGDFSARTEVVTGDELGEMATALNAMLDSMVTMIQSQEERDRTQEAIIKLMSEIDDLTRGDLTARAEVTEDITGAIADSFNTMAEQFGDIVKQVKGATFDVDENASEVSTLTMQLAERSDKQNAQVTSTIDSMQQIVESIRAVSRNAAQSTKVSLESRKNAQEGAETVRQTNQAMDELREQINETARSIKRLGESSMEIGNIVEIIEGIADRTSILALNASIQAATAGDAGHGFAVVAEEVQRLAESSTKSTRQIESLIKSIQAEIKDVSNRMDESISKVVQGATLADNAYAKLAEIENIANELGTQIESITKASAEQVSISERVMKDMLAVGKVSRDTSTSSKATAERMKLLTKTSHGLRDAVETFRVEKAA